MDDTKDMRQKLHRATIALELMKEDDYNTRRPDAQLIEELLELILLLDHRTERLEDELRAVKEMTAD